MDLDKHGFDLDFAIQHLHSVVKEMGVFIRVVKEGEIVSMPAFRRTAAVGGRSSNLRELGGGPYRPSLRPNFTRVRRALARRFRRLLGG